MRNLKTQFKNKTSGFTLVELIVSLGLFTIVVMIAMGAMLSLSDTNRKVKTMRIAMDNLNMALDSMSREIRMGSVYTCNPSLPVTLSYGDVGADCVNGASSLAFFSQDGDTMVYRLNGTTIQRSKNGGSSGSFSDMTAADITIDELVFYVRGAGSGVEQPRVIISLSGTVNDKVSSSFRLQTTATQKLAK